jgi:ABC-2 type transport system permease protein
VIVGISSQTLAGEFARGTLRNLVLRPVRRWQIALGKLVALALLTLLAYSVLAAVSVLGAGLWFEFSGLTELLPDGQRMELGGFSAEELRAHLWPALVAPIAPLVAWCAVGVAASAVVRHGALALAHGLGAFVFTDLASALARGTGSEGWLLSAHLPSPLGDTSFIHYYSDLTQGISNAEFLHSETQWTAPCVWFALALAVAVLSLQRRSLP